MKKDSRKNLEENPKSDLERNNSKYLKLFKYFVFKEAMSFLFNSINIEISDIQIILQKLSEAISNLIG